MKNKTKYAKRKLLRRSKSRLPSQVKNEECVRLPRLHTGVKRQNSEKGVSLAVVVPHVLLLVRLTSQEDGTMKKSTDVVLPLSKRVKSKAKIPKPKNLIATKTSIEKPSDAHLHLLLGHLEAQDLRAHLFDQHVKQMILSCSTACAQIKKFLKKF